MRVKRIWGNLGESCSEKVVLIVGYEMDSSQGQVYGNYIGKLWCFFNPF